MPGTAVIWVLNSSPRKCAPRPRPPSGPGCCRAAGACRPPKTRIERLFAKLARPERPAVGQAAQLTRLRARNEDVRAVRAEGRVGRCAHHILVPVLTNRILPVFASQTPCRRCSSVMAKYRPSALRAYSTRWRLNGLSPEISISSESLRSATFLSVAASYTARSTLHERSFFLLLPTTHGRPVRGAAVEIIVRLGAHQDAEQFAGFGVPGGDRAQVFTVRTASVSMRP